MPDPADAAIARSISHTEIVTIDWSPASELALAEVCDDSVQTETVVEYWGTDEDGSEWRVHLDTTGRQAKIERSMRTLAEQDQSGTTDDSYASTGDAVDTIRRWYAAATTADDVDLVTMIDAIGVKVAAHAYEAARSWRK